MVRNGLHLRTYSLRFKYLITIILTVERFQKGKKKDRHEDDSYTRAYMLHNKSGHFAHKFKFHTNQ